MNDDIIGSLERMAEKLEQRAERLAELNASIDALSATAGRPDGMIKVVVGPHGRVEDLALDPRVYRKLSPNELSEEILRLIDEAVEDISDQTEELVRPYLPEGLPVPRDLDLATLLSPRSAVRPPQRGARP